MVPFRDGGGRATWPPPMLAPGVTTTLIHLKPSSDCRRKLALPRPETAWQHAVSLLPVTRF